MLTLCKAGRLQVKNLFSLVLFFTLLLGLLPVNYFGLVAYGASTELKLTILHTNDEHSALIPHSPTLDWHPYRNNPTVGGYARLATAVEQIRSEKSETNEPVLLISAGDYIGGSPFSWLIPEGYAPEITIKQSIGYDFVTIGNHEYDYGPDQLAAYFKTAGYPAAHAQTMILASNTVAPADHPLAAEDLYREKSLVTLSNGLTVGLFALIGEQAISYTTANDPVAFSDQHETAARLVKELQSEGAEIIIAITHARVEEDQALALAVPGINVIVGGHRHSELHEPLIENGTIILQAGSLLHYLGCLELSFNRETGDLQIHNGIDNRPFLIPLEANYRPEPEVAALVDQYRVILDQYLSEQTAGRFQSILDPVIYAEFVLSNEPPLRESPFGNFITDAMRLITWEKTGLRADFAVQANGAIRGKVTPATMPHALGQVSVYDLTELVGLGIGPDGHAGYSVVAAYLTGEEVRRVLEAAVLLSEMMGDPFFIQFSGLRYSYNPDNAILLTIPFLDLPIPTSRAVVSAERYSGEGRQNNEQSAYLPLERGDEQLYCLITDSYLVSFLPMIGELVPNLAITLKDQAGNPVAEDQLDQLIVIVGNRDLKVWETVLEYAASHPEGAAGLPVLDAYYAEAVGRITTARSFPLIAWLLALILLILVMIMFLFRLRRKRRTGRH